LSTGVLEEGIKVSRERKELLSREIVEKV